MDTPSTPNQPAKSSRAVLWAVLIVIIIAAIVVAMVIQSKDDSNSSKANGNVNSVANQNTNLTANTNTEKITRSTPYLTDEYELKLPEDLYVVRSSGGAGQTEFRRDAIVQPGDYSNTFLIIKADKQPPARVNGVDILLDEVPSASAPIDGLSANVYKFASGYDSTPPFIVYRVLFGDTYYRLEFWNTSDATDEVNSVIDSFHFNK